MRGIPRRSLSLLLLGVLGRRFYTYKVGPGVLLHGTNAQGREDALAAASTLKTFELALLLGLGLGQLQARFVEVLVEGSAHRALGGQPLSVKSVRASTASGGVVRFVGCVRLPLCLSVPQSARFVGNLRAEHSALLAFC